jgi:hypothetical protein
MIEKGPTKEKNEEKGAHESQNEGIDSQKKFGSANINV